MTAMGYAPPARLRDDVIRLEAGPPAPAATASAMGATLPVIMVLVVVAVARPGWSVTALVLMITAGLTVLQARARVAAYRAGCAAERARLLRSLHDTVLQALETMALTADADRLAPADELTRLRGTARRQSTLLRLSLSELTGRVAPGRSLAEALGEVISEMPADGPRVELVAGADLPEPERWRQECLRDATREALGNVVKHAAAGRVTVRVAAAQGGVEVVVRDDGRGFDPGLTTPGFGTRQSITARVREAGGAAAIGSWPGHGTRVRLWMPARLTTTPRRPRR